MSKETAEILCKELVAQGNTVTIERRRTGMRGPFDYVLVVMDSGYRMCFDSERELRVALPAKSAV